MPKTKLQELVIMGPAAFILDFFFYGSLSKKIAFRIVTPGKDTLFLVIQEKENYPEGGICH